LRRALKRGSKRAETRPGGLALAERRDTTNHVSTGRYVRAACEFRIQRLEARERLLPRHRLVVNPVLAHMTIMLILIRLGARPKKVSYPAGCLHHPSVGPFAFPIRCREERRNNLSRRGGPCESNPAKSVLRMHLPGDTHLRRPLKSLAKLVLGYLMLCVPSRSRGALPTRTGTDLCGGPQGSTAGVSSADSARSLHGARRDSPKNACD
jgi:hypothetical protein